MPHRARLYIVCSDRPRNGKTLLARFLADWLTHAGEDPLLYDLDVAAGGLAAHYPQAQRVHFQRTPERVALFDSLVGLSGRDVVIDIPASLLSAFLEEAEAIGLIEALMAEGPEPFFLHVIDRSPASLRHAAALKARYPGNVRPVRNLALGELPDEADSASLYLDLCAAGEIVLPRLSPPALEVVERPGFSFAAFMEGRLAVPSPRLDFELRDICSNVFSQLDRLRLSLGFEDLRDMGLV
jgi:hypothetical protein